MKNWYLILRSNKMSKNKEKIFTIEDIQDAYRKLKTHTLLIITIQLISSEVLINTNLIDLKYHHI